MRRSLALCLVLIISLHTVGVPRVCAPPMSYGYICGLVSASNTDVRVSEITVNAIIIPDRPDGENLTHSIEVSSRYNITNTANHEVSFFTSFARCSETPQNVYLGFSNKTSIEGNTSLCDASIAYNISTQEGLPEGIVSRYPSRFFSSYFSVQIDVVNLTMAPYASLILSTQTLFSVRCIGNYYDLRYGLDLMKLSADSALLDGCFEVTNTSLLVRTDFLNGQFCSVNQADDSIAATWSIYTWDWESQAPYPGLQFDDGIFSDYLGVQLWQAEYFPPTFDLTQSYFPLGTAIAILVVVLLLWGKRGSRPTTGIMSSVEGPFHSS